MNKITQLTIITVLMCIGFTSNAQQKQEYSYITDRMFHDPSELIGYNFKPNEMEVVDETKEEIKAGQYSFGISRNNLYVEGRNIRGVYSVNNINPTEYGFKLLLMNARDPTIQGHLKIILTKNRHVDALIFKRSRKDKEIIFFLPEMSDKQWKREQDYFTDRWETVLEHKDSLWGMSVVPFMRIHQDQDGVQERLDLADSTKISFYKTVKVIEKIKKVKKKGKKKDKDNQEEKEVKEEIAEEDLVGEEEANGDEEEVTEDGVKKKIKIITEYFIKVRSIITYKDGGQEDKEWVYKIEGLKERVDYEAPKGADKFEIEVKRTKGDPVYIYLNSERAFSSIEVDGKVYRMQGH